MNNKHVISIIMAISANGIIGDKGDMPWRGQLPNDMKRFRELTMGHPVIMGRKTHESIGKTLPGRTNFVISRQNGYKPSEESVLATSLEQALTLARKSPGSKEAFIIGGKELYEQAAIVSHRVYRTLIHGYFEGDTFFHFKHMFPRSEWVVKSREIHGKDNENNYACSFEIFEKTSQQKEEGNDLERLADEHL